MSSLHATCGRPLCTTLCADVDGDSHAMMEGDSADRGTGDMVGGVAVDVTLRIRFFRGPFLAGENFSTCVANTEPD